MIWSKDIKWEFPGGPVVNNTGLIPGSEKIPHAAGQLNNVPQLLKTPHA